MRKLMVLAVLLGLAACNRSVDFRTVLPKEGWKTYHDDVRGVTCWFYQHPSDVQLHFGVGCVPDSQWKK